MKRAEFVELLDKSFDDTRKDSIVRWCKGVILIYIDAKENAEISARLAYLQEVLELKETQKIVCICQALKELNYSNEGEIQFSQDKEAEYRLTKLLCQVTKNNLEEMVSQL